MSFCSKFIVVYMCQCLFPYSTKVWQSDCKDKTVQFLPPNVDFNLLLSANVMVFNWQLRAVHCVHYNTFVNWTMDQTSCRTANVIVCTYFLLCSRIVLVRRQWTMQSFIGRDWSVKTSLRIYIGLRIDEYTCVTVLYMWPSWKRVSHAVTGSLHYNVCKQ